MENFYLGKNKYQFKTAWEELESEEFIKLISLYNQYLQGEISFLDLRNLFTLYIYDIPALKSNNEQVISRFSENIYQISSRINFYLDIHYPNTKSFNTLSKETRLFLLKNPPEDLPEGIEKKLALKLKYQYRFNNIITKNLIPSFKPHKKTELKAYRFNITDGIVETSLTAAQFITAQTLIYQLEKNPNSNQLFSLLCATLFQESNYSDEISIKNVELFKTVTQDFKNAVLFNFNAIQNFITSRTKYSILFRTHENGKKKITDNLVDFKQSVYSLAKSGHGTSIEIENESLFKYFDKLIYELKCSVKALSDAKKTNVEIAEILKLTPTQVVELLQ